MRLHAVLFLFATSVAFSQAAPPSQPSSLAPAPATAEAVVTLPAGTKVLMVMKNSVSSRNARQGDGVYLETTFPVVERGHVVIPAGTFVQGVIDRVKRSGRVKGRAEITMHFNTLIYPNGYTVSLPGALESAGGNDSQKVKDQEGTIQAESSKGKDTATVATSGGTGAVIGGLSRGLKGAGIGAGVGGAVGVVTALLTRGDEVRLEPGTSVEMILQRSVPIEVDRVAGSAPPYRTAPPDRSRRLERPTLNPRPGQG